MDWIKYGWDTTKNGIDTVSCKLPENVIGVVDVAADGTYHFINKNLFEIENECRKKEEECKYNIVIEGKSSELIEDEEKKCHLQFINCAKTPKIPKDIEEDVKLPKGGKKRTKKRKINKKPKQKTNKERNRKRNKKSKKQQSI